MVAYFTIVIIIQQNIYDFGGPNHTIAYRTIIPHTMIYHDNYSLSLSKKIVYLIYLLNDFAYPPINELLITHGASEESGVRNFWHLSAKILYTVEPKTVTSPCVHFEVAASPTEKKTLILHVSILTHFEIMEIIGPNTTEII